MNPVLPAKPLAIESPSAKYEQVLSSLSSNEVINGWQCDYQIQLHQYLVDNSVINDASRAYSLYYTPYTRAALNALLMCNEPISEIAMSVEEEELVILAYSKLFFDTRVFPNKLIKLAYIRQLPSGIPSQDFEKSLLIAGIQLGPKYIYWKLGIATEYNPATSEVYSELMKDSFWKFKELRAKNDMEVTKEARSWVPLAISAAGSVDKIGTKRDNSADEPISIKLISISKNLNLEDISKDIKG